jgi:hypothetical protein
MPLTRDDLLRAIREATEPRETVLAFWEAGSKAMGAADQWSDLDLQLLVQDGAQAETIQAVEEALLRLSPIDLRFEVPQPTFHGHWQAFYRLAEAGPYLLIDLVIMQESEPNRYLEPEIHGIATVYFDKQGLIVPPHIASEAFAAELAQRIPLLETPAELFHIFVEKELRRGRELDALHYYQGTLITRLVQALRMRYCPWRYNFGLRYLQRDLPEAVYQELRPLLFVADPAELAEKKAAALALLRRTLAELKQLDLTAHVEAGRQGRVE